MKMPREGEEARGLVEGMEHFIRESVTTSPLSERFLNIFICFALFSTFGAFSEA